MSTECVICGNVRYRTAVYKEIKDRKVETLGFRTAVYKEIRDRKVETLGFRTVIHEEIKNHKVETPGLLTILDACLIVPVAVETFMTT
jgi:hypothetical protein